MFGQGLLMKWQKRLQHWINPISPSRLQQTLDSLMPSKVEVLLMHSSLSSCGRFTGGANGVLDDVASRASTLLLPTHTYCYPESSDSVGPVFDAQKTPSRNGALTELFRSRPDTVRSIHATHSLAARGPMAAEIVSGHWQSQTACGRGTPYDKLLDRKGSVLMFGVSFHSYTLYHTAEDAAESPYAYEERTSDKLRVVDENGDVRICPSKRQSRVPRRFALAGEHLVAIGLVKKVPLRRSYLYFVEDCRAVHEYLVKKLKDYPDYLYHNCSTELK